MAKRPIKTDTLHAAAQFADSAFREAEALSRDKDRPWAEMMSARVLVAMGCRRYLAAQRNLLGQGTSSPEEFLKFCYKAYRRQT